MIVARSQLAIAFFAAMSLAARWGAPPAHAGNLDRDYVEATLVAESRTIRPGQSLWVGIRLSMQRGWHVNWINPGDAGLAPTVTWRLPDQFRAGELQWPYPNRFPFPGVAIFGYQEDVVLLAELTPPASLPVGGQVTIEAHVDWLACREACVPGGEDVKLTLEVTGEEPSPDPGNARVFEQTRAKLPAVAPGWRFAGSLDERRLVITVIPPEGESAELEDVMFFPVEQGVIESASPQTLRRTESVYELEVERARLSQYRPTRLQGVLVSKKGWGDSPQKAVLVDAPLTERTQH